MAVTRVAAKCKLVTVAASSITLDGYTSGVAAGDVMIAMVASLKAKSGSDPSGWTLEGGASPAGAYLNAYSRVADGTSSDNCTVNFASSGNVCGVLAVFTADAGFGVPAIKNYSYVNGEYSTTTSLALWATPGVAFADTYPVGVGCDVYSASQNITIGLSGTNWAVDQAWSGSAVGHGVIGHHSSPSYIYVPSVTFSSGVTGGKFIFFAGLKEAVPSNLAGGGLFWAGGA